MRIRWSHVRLNIFTNCFKEEDYHRLRTIKQITWNSIDLIRVKLVIFSSRQKIRGHCHVTFAIDPLTQKRWRRVMKGMAHESSFCTAACSTTSFCPWSIQEAYEMYLIELSTGVVSVGSMLDLSKKDKMRDSLGQLSNAAHSFGKKAKSKCF